MRNKRLTEILQGLMIKKIEGNQEEFITGITYDSRKVQPGYLFCCLKGTKYDGHVFASRAQENGAGAFLVEKNIEVAGATTVTVPSVRSALPYLAANFYDHPSRQLSLVGVTGTNGKTTTTHLIEKILSSSGEKTGLIGTISCKIGEEEKPVLATTPESVDLQGLLWEMKEKEVQTAVMEVSSHAMAMDRVVGCDFDTAVLTNITGDHLDYHKTFENYRAAKGKLFSSLGGVLFKNSLPRVSVINSDDASYDFISQQSSVQRITYGLNPLADVRAVDVAASPAGSSFKLVSPFGREPINLKLAGLFNVYNALAAAAVGLSRDIKLSKVKEVLEEVEGIAGRFEKVECGQNFLVVVDYAHTPDGLENLLKAAQTIAERDIITVFGCGGDRDASKRPLMGELAITYSHLSILTSDNPRGEDPAAIARDVEKGMSDKPGKEYRVILDRYEAIKEAIFTAKEKDIVIIAGKGHEDYQIFKDRTIHFSDREAAEELLRERLTNDTDEGSRSH